jgi:predicted nucleic acid-binding Zn ribbon protein
VAQPVRVGALLGALVPGLDARLAERRLVESWPTLAGPAAARTRADGVESGVLHVRVDSPAWLHRLTLEEATLVARCSQVAAIRAIRFHLAPLDARGDS